MSAPGPCRFVKLGVVQCDSIPALEQEAFDQADKAVEQGEFKPSVNVSKFST